nr:ParA family protein [Actinoplanes brasiliensis]
MEDEDADRVYVPGTSSNPAPPDRDVEPFWAPEELEAPVHGRPVPHDTPPPVPLPHSPNGAPGMYRPGERVPVPPPHAVPVPPPAHVQVPAPRPATHPPGAHQPAAHQPPAVHQPPAAYSPAQPPHQPGPAPTQAWPNLEPHVEPPAAESPPAEPHPRAAVRPAAAPVSGSASVPPSPSVPTSAAPASAAPMSPAGWVEDESGVHSSPDSPWSQPPHRPGAQSAASSPAEQPRPGATQVPAQRPPGTASTPAQRSHSGTASTPAPSNASVPAPRPELKTSPSDPADEEGWATGAESSNSAVYRPAAQGAAVVPPQPGPRTHPDQPGPHSSPDAEELGPRPDQLRPHAQPGPHLPQQAGQPGPHGAQTYPQPGPHAAQAQPGPYGQPYPPQNYGPPPVPPGPYPPSMSAHPPAPAQPATDPFQDLPWVSDGTPTAEEFARRRMAKPADPVATQGARAILRKGTMGLVKLAPGKREQEYKQDVEMVRRNFGGLRQVTVVNPKGGAGKTVAVLLLAMTFGQKRGGYVLAWDNNETQGTLGMRAQQDFHARTVRDMMRDLHLFRGSHGRVGDLSQYVRAQGEGMFDVLASDESATAGEMLTADAFGEIREIVSRFYKLIFVDTGNNVRAQNWQAAMDATDQLVITMSARNDSAETAARMLDHLEQTGRQRLVRQAVSVVSMPPTRKDIDLPAIQRHFAARTRAVLLAPYEKLIDSGEPIRYGHLSNNTKDAWLKIAAAVAEGL